MSRHIAIVTPVLDDWDSLEQLVAAVSEHCGGRDLAIHFVVVDDGSGARCDPDAIAVPPESCIASVEILRLALNLGHQRAIAVGLCAIAERSEFDAVIVMDCDGEDRPSDIAALVAAGEGHPAHVVVARRSKRSEALAFRLMYRAFKLLFHLLVGRTIDFGNFSLIPMAAVHRLVHMPELWNNLAAAIMRSRLQYDSVPTIRGRRYAGRSRMNFVSLIVHGLSAMSVYTDMIFVRILIAAAIVASLSILGMVGITVIRFATDLAIPGWATMVGGDLLIILLQTVVIVVATSLMMLAGRSSRPIIPVIDAQPFIAERLVRHLDRAAVKPALARAS